MQELSAQNLGQRVFSDRFLAEQVLVVKAQVDRHEAVGLEVFDPVSFEAELMIHPSPSS